MSKEKKQILVIVESPTKTKTISKILGSKYKVIASFGHIRDLPSSKIGVDIDSGFVPKYEIDKSKKSKVEAIKKESSKSSLVLLGTDPDREGEAISWHISQILPKGTSFKRIVFNAIEEEAILNAIESQRDIDDKLVDSQKARRILDRLAGYKGSSWLNRFLKSKGLSCGRVQSVALKFLVDREKSIRDFVPLDYWSITANFKIKDIEQEFKLKSINGNKIERVSNGETLYHITSEEQVKNIIDQIECAKDYKIEDIKERKVKKAPKPPYTTSTLQQDAGNRLGMSVSKAMKLAQDLYEGIGGESGYITYMRTDSVNIEPKNIEKINEFIKKNFPKEAESKSRSYKSSKSAQEAHEAIRPTNIEFTPEEARKKLSEEHSKIYELIWKRTIASQMKNAIYGTVTYTVKDSDKKINFVASGTVILEKGYTKMYKEESGEDAVLDLNVETGYSPKLLNTKSKKSTTKPPARYSEASLVKKLESESVGRPSTYAPTIDRIGKYIEKDSKSLVPTKSGEEVCSALDAHLPILTSASFTSELEEKLEEIEEGTKQYEEVMNIFWGRFKTLLEEAQKHITAVEKVITDKDCPNCKEKMFKISWKGSYFYGCSAHPKCKYSESDKKKKEISIKEYDILPDFNLSRQCIKCGKDMKLRSSSYGIFLGCSNYPKCKSTMSIPMKSDISEERCSKCDRQKVLGRGKNNTYCFICDLK